MDVSILVTSDLPIAAERPMYFNYKGKWTGGHVGAPLTPSTSLFFAEGYTGEGFEEWLCLANPREEKAVARVELLGVAGSLGSVEVEIPARSRRTLNINELAGAGVDVSIRWTSGIVRAVCSAMWLKYE